MTTATERRLLKWLDTFDPISARGLTLEADAFKDGWELSTAEWMDESVRVKVKGRTLNGAVRRFLDAAEAKATESSTLAIEKGRS